MDEKIINTKHEPDDNYQRGLVDAWETARKLIKLKEHERANLFIGNPFISDIINNWTVNEVIKKLKGFEDTYLVGDEVILNDLTRAVVLDIPDYDSVIVMTENECVECYDKESFQAKTGRHFAEVSKLIDALREEKE